MKDLKHPNIVRCHRTFESNQKLNIILEFCEKKDLEAYLKQEEGVPITEEMIWTLFTQVCFGVLSLHQRKILHRDLKIANIFMTHDNTVKIGDLGISK